MEITYVDEFEGELRSLPAPELQAMANALEKLSLFGDQLGFPHSSLVMGTTLRELRPRAGRSRWRALYKRVEKTIVVAAIAPEALHNPRGFRRALANAEARLHRYEEAR